MSIPVSTKRTPGPALLVMPIFGGLIGVDVLEGPPSHSEYVALESQRFRAYMGRDESISATAALKSKMEQAVFYGDRKDVGYQVSRCGADSQNPLSFDLAAGSQGDVAVAAEAVSRDILSACK